MNKSFFLRLNVKRECFTNNTNPCWSINIIHLFFNMLRCDLFYY